MVGGSAQRASNENSHFDSIFRSQPAVPGPFVANLRVEEIPATGVFLWTATGPTYFTIATGSVTVTFAGHTTAYAAKQKFITPPLATTIRNNGTMPVQLVMLRAFPG